MNAKKLGFVMLLCSLVFAGSSPSNGVWAAPPGPTLVDVAIEANSEGGSYEGQFDTLIAAVLAADPVVLQILDGNGQNTVFAPTDEAFGKMNLDETNIGTLPQDLLTTILLYHVSPGRRDAESILDSRRIRMRRGGFLKQSGGVLTDNLGRTSNIIVTDIPAANGIIHGIDTVVLPVAP